MTQNIRTAAAFMTLGLSAHIAPLSIDIVLDHWDGGCLELIQSVTDYAPYADALATAARAVVGDYPGVFDYEVCEPFGEWYAAQVMQTEGGGVAPDEEQCRAKLRDLVLEFFSFGKPDAKLIEALAAVEVPHG